MSHKFWAIALLIILGLPGCSGNQAAENLFAPDAKLKEKSETPVIPDPNSTATNTQEIKIPAEFPQNIPLYPQAKLINIEAGLTPQQGFTRWESDDPSNLIENYYQKTLLQENWQIISQPNSQDNSQLVAKKDDLEIKLEITSTSAKTQFIIEYQQRQNLTQTPETSTSPITTPNTPSNISTNFSDLDQAPEPLRKYIEDLAKLGFLTSSKNSDKFDPNQTITRREYANWLFNANNIFYANQPSKQIRLADKNIQPIFKDIPTTDPDFPIIQGLAEAGLIPSPLTGDTSASLFRPDAFVTRETLILWKVPLDTRKNLPLASLDSVKEVWGFQDVSKIDPKILRSLYGDFQNGDQANIHRAFGYTTLFQPKKPVTRAQAAAVLWYFGYQGDGISAEDVLKTQAG